MANSLYCLCKELHKPGTCQLESVVTIRIIMTYTLVSLDCGLLLCPMEGLAPHRFPGLPNSARQLFVQMEFSQSETIVAGPEFDFFFHGKDLAGSHGKTRFELEGLGFERNVDP